MMTRGCSASDWEMKVEYHRNNCTAITKIMVFAHMLSCNSIILINDNDDSGDDENDCVCYDGDAYGGSGEIDNTYREC